MPEIISLSQTL